MRTISTDDKFRQNKAFLIRYRILSEKIERLENKLAQIDEDMAALKSPKLTGEPKASVRITLDDKLIQHDELEYKIIDFLHKLKKSELEQLVLQILFDGPEWQYERFIAENIDL